MDQWIGLSNESIRKRFNTLKWEVIRTYVLHTFW